MQGQGVGPVTEVINPGGVLREVVEEVAVDHEQPATVRRFVNAHIDEFHVAKGLGGEGPEKLVVVARDVNDPSAPLEHAENPADHEARGVGPVERSLQLPAVDHVADEVQPVGLDPAEKLK